MWISTFPVCWTFFKIDYSVFIEWFLSSCPCSFRNLGVLVCCGIYVSVSMPAPLDFDYCALVQVFICGYVQLCSQGTSTVIVPVFIFVVSINVAVSGAESPLVCGFWRRLVVGWCSFCVRWWRFHSTLNQLARHLLFTGFFWLLIILFIMGLLRVHSSSSLLLSRLCPQPFLYLISVPHSCICLRDFFSNLSRHFVLPFVIWYYFITHTHGVEV
jgi:hypothetical protein